MRWTRHHCPFDARIRKDETNSNFVHSTWLAEVENWIPGAIGIQFEVRGCPRALSHILILISKLGEKLHAVVNAIVSFSASSLSNYLSLGIDEYNLGFSFKYWKNFYEFWRHDPNPQLLVCIFVYTLRYRKKNFSATKSAIFNFLCLGNREF